MGEEDRHADRQGGIVLVGFLVHRGLEHHEDQEEGTDDLAKEGAELGKAWVDDIRPETVGGIGAWPTFRPTSTRLGSNALSRTILGWSRCGPRFRARDGDAGGPPN